MSLWNQLTFFALLFGPAVYYLLKSDFRDSGFFTVTVLVLVACFFGAYQVLATAYTEKMVVGIAHASDYVSPRGYRHDGYVETYCEPEYRHESWYHAILWLAPLAALLLVDGLHEAVRLRRPLAPGRYLRYLLLLYPAYLLLSYDALVRYQPEHESPFYIRTEKPRCACPPDGE